MRIEFQSGRAGPAALVSQASRRSPASPPARPLCCVRGARPVFGVLLLALALGAYYSARADNLVPFEFRQRKTTYNLQSLRGVPISSVSNSPAGSDGRLLCP